MLDPNPQKRIQTIVLIGLSEADDAMEALVQLASRAEHHGFFVTFRDLSSYASDSKPISPEEAVALKQHGLMALLEGDQDALHFLKHFASEFPRCSYDCGTQSPEGELQLVHFGTSSPSAPRFQRLSEGKIQP